MDYSLARAAAVEALDAGVADRRERPSVIASACSVRAVTLDAPIP